MWAYVLFGTMSANDYCQNRLQLQYASADPLNANPISARGFVYVYNLKISLSLSLPAQDMCSAGPSNS